MKVRKILARIGSPILLIALLSMNVGAMTNFYQVYLPIIGGERFLATEAKSISSTTNPVVSITSIKKGDGTSSSYSQIYCFVCIPGVVSSDHVLVTKGTPKSISMPAKYKALGTKLSLKGYGKNALLDCMVTGYFTAN